MMLDHQLAEKLGVGKCAQQYISCLVTITNSTAIVFNSRTCRLVHSNNSAKEVSPEKV